MPTISQLPVATNVTAADTVPISQSGTTRAAAVGELLASTQPAITIASPSLLGRTSLGSGGPEQITPGIGLSLGGGVLIADGADHATFPAVTALVSDVDLVASQQGSPMLVPASLLRGLFAAGQGVTISPSGTIAASGTVSVTPGAGLGSAIAGLTTITSLSAQDLVPASHAGLDYAIPYANLINGITIDQAQSAAAVGDTDTLWVAQGGNVMTSQSFSAIWSWIGGKLPTYKTPVVEITANLNLDTTVHNNRLLICSQPVTLTPLATNMGSGFRCVVLNASTGNVTLGSGFVSSTGSLSLLPWQSASILCASYSGGVVVFASMPGASSAPAVPPGQITTLAATGTTTSSITLSWQASATGAAPSSYTIQYRLSGTTTWTSAPPIAATTYQIAGLLAGTGYDITILAVAAGASGPLSAILTVSTAAAVTTALPLVTNLSATPGSSSTVSLAWASSGGTATSFTAQYRVTGTPSWTSLTGITATSTVVPSLLPSTSYDFSVYGINSAGTGALSSIVTASTPAAAQTVSSITWNLAPSGAYARGSGSIGVNAHVSPATSPVQFGFSTSATTPPSTWTPASLVNTDLWGAYLPTPATAGTWYVWAEGLDGSALTVNTTSFAVQ